MCDYAKTVQFKNLHPAHHMYRVEDCPYYLLEREGRGCSFVGCYRQEVRRERMEGGDKCSDKKAGMSCAAM